MVSGYSDDLRGEVGVSDMGGEGYDCSRLCEYDQRGDLAIFKSGLRSRAVDELVVTCAYPA